MTNADDREPLDCARAREQLSACCDGEAERTPRLAAHLDGCAACRDFADGCGGITRAFEPLRTAAPPADLAQRLLAHSAPRRWLVLRGGVGDGVGGVGAGAGTDAGSSAVARVAAGLIGLAAIGGFGAWLAARPCAPDARSRGPDAVETAASRASAGWLEPLSGRALHPGDAPLHSWSDAMVFLVSAERKSEERR